VICPECKEPVVGCVELDSSDHMNPFYWVYVRCTDRDGCKWTAEREMWKRVDGYTEAVERAEGRAG